MITEKKRGDGPAVPVSQKVASTGDCVRKSREAGAAQLCHWSRALDKHKLKSGATAEGAREARKLGRHGDARGLGAGDGKR